MRVVRRGLSCDECGGTEFEKDDSGFFTCIACGVQRTEAEEKQEYDDIATGTRRKVQLLRLPTQHKQETHPFQLTLHDSRLLLETFHFLLHAQCSALLAAFQLTPQLVSVIGRLWVNYVRWWQREGWGADEESMVVFKVGPGIKVGQVRQKVREEERTWQQAKVATDAAGTELTGAESGEQQQYVAEDSKEQSPAAPWRPLDVAELSLPLSLAILYVALQSCRSPVTMHQLVSLARINRIPYLNFIQPATLPPRLHTLLATSPSVRSFYRPSVLPATATLLVLAHHVAAVVGLVDAEAGKVRRGLSTAAAFGLHDQLFHVSGCVRAYMRQLHVPEPLYGLCMAMTRVYTAVLEQKRDKRWTRVRRQRRTERKDEAREDDEDEERQQEGGDTGSVSGGHDEWSVMVCVVTVLKLVYGLDRVADRSEQGKKEHGAGEQQPAQDEDGQDEQHVAEAESSQEEEPNSAEEEAAWMSDAARAERQVNLAERWQTEQEELEELEMLRQVHREEEEERQRKEQEKADLDNNCNSLLQMLAADCSPHVSSSLDADMVRLLNPSTHFPSTLYEARHLRPDQQEDLLRLWDDAILPPSLAIDDYGEYIDKINTLHPPLAPAPDSASASGAASKPSLASLWHHLSSTLSHCHHATFRQFSRSTQHASQPLHADYALIVHCAALLCGLSVDSLHSRLLWWGEQLWRWMGRKRSHSVGWRQEDKETRWRKERARRRRKRRRQEQEEAEDNAQYSRDEGGEEEDERDVAEAEEETEEQGSEDDQRDDDEVAEADSESLGEGSQMEEEVDA